MGLYSKFNVNLNINGQDYVDCRAFFEVDGKIKRIGADENNNCENCLTEIDVMNERIKIGVPFASLKTEEEIQPKITQVVIFPE